MKVIKALVDQINEELNSAEDYAEKWLEYRADGLDSQFKQMADDELKHAMYIHDLAIEKITNLKSVYTPPVEMQAKWDECHTKFTEKYAEIKRMLSL